MKVAHKQGHRKFCFDDLEVEDPVPPKAHPIQEKKGKYDFNNYDSDE